MVKKILALLLIGNVVFCMNPEKTIERKCTLLHELAYAHGASSYLSKYLEEMKGKNQSIDPKDPEDYTPFLVALRAGNPEAAKLLFDAGADYTCVGKDKKTALQHAAQTGNLEMVKQLIKAGLKLDEKDSFGETVFHSLTHSGPGMRPFSDYWLRLYQALCADYMLCHQKNTNSNGFQEVKRLLEIVNDGGSTAEQVAEMYANNLVVAVFRAHATENAVDNPHRISLSCVQALRLLRSEKEQAEQRAQRAEKIAADAQELLLKIAKKS